MKKTTALAAVLAFALMFSACAQSKITDPSDSSEEETSITTVSDPDESEGTEETEETQETQGISQSEQNDKEPNLFGNPDLENPVDDYFYVSKDVDTSWVTNEFAFYGLFDWIMYYPIVSGSELTAEFPINPEAVSGSQIKLFIFEHNDDYAWNTDDALSKFNGDACSTVNGDVYWCKGYLPKGMETGVYTLVVTHMDGTVDCMYDFDVVATAEEAEGGEAVMKPVIYLYPETSTEVSVGVDFDGKIDCTYPKYDPMFGWRVVADPDGHLYNIEDGRDYDYLFWDGTTVKDLDSFNNAICVRGCDTAKFLEGYLEAAGLNDSEIDDFVSFWLPMMEKNEYNLISFPTEEYEEMAKLNVSPAPDTMIRVYMVFAGVDEMIDVPSEQQLVYPENVTRDGFTVVEWGGSMVDYNG
ncbi:MAG: hypothetical protein K6G47_08905 [Clostridia bacterium]|nr:hypothetical protein [Clostridia bacterium]